MLREESLWISEKTKEILSQKPFPAINIGSSTLKYRTVTQPYIQKNIFSLFTDEKNQVLHIDMKKENGVDLAGNLYDAHFRENLKKLKPRLIFCNNLLMYLNAEMRRKTAEILYDILDTDGYLIVTNSHVFPPAHDPVESYYRATPEIMYKELFNSFTLLDSNITETGYNFYSFLKSNPKILLVKFIRLFMPFYKTKEWWFLLKYYTFDLKKNYSASCLFLKK